MLIKTFHRSNGRTAEIHDRLAGDGQSSLFVAKFINKGHCYMQIDCVTFSGALLTIGEDEGYDAGAAAQIHEANQSDYPRGWDYLELDPATSY